MPVRLRRSVTLGFGASLVIAFALIVGANIDGAIFITYPDGTEVNANIFLSKADAYLNGGPQNENANGLPDQTYYYQVTDPNGGTLLSNDDITCRQIVVAGGIVAGVPSGSAPAACTDTLGSFHALGTQNNNNGGSIPVQLIPFDDTPNNGGEYKAWITPKSDYDAFIVGGGIPSATNNWGFFSSNTKTDNFKVNATIAHITVCKFNDIDANHIRNGEPLIRHWPINATGVLPGTENAQTNDNGCVTFTVSDFPLDGNTALVTLSEGTFGPDWSRTAPADGSYPHGFTALGGVISVTVSVGDRLKAPDFGNHSEQCGVNCNPGGLVVTKTALPNLKHTFKWDITKGVDETEIHTAAGSGATFEYTVNVTHDSGTDSDWQVTGKITVANPGSGPISGIDVNDAVDNGGSCAVTGGSALTIAGGSHKEVPYTCTYATAPANGTNTATASVVGLGNFTGTAAIDFDVKTITNVDDCVKVKDTIGGTLGTVCSGDESPTTFTYSNTVTAPSGACKTVDNTASFTTNTNGTTGSDSKSAKVCGGADLLVSKTANPAFKRTYKWKISKDVDKTLVKQVGGTATFNYTVKAEETSYVDSEWTVTGTITVTNPNNWEAITADITDAIDNGGLCTVANGAGVLVPAGGSAALAYTCTYASAPNASSGTNTGTATWNKATFFTPNGSATGTAGAVFGAPTNTVNKTITVTDTFNSGSPATLGTLTATDTTPYASAPYTYVHTVSAPALNCMSYLNTAKIVETGQTATQTIKVCGPAKTGALTMGFWQNKNGQDIIKAGASVSGICKSGTGLRQYASFQDLSATATCTQVATYVTNVIKAANASGAAMNAMLKAQMLATALDVYFSDPALGGNKINAPAPIGGVTIDLTKINKLIFSANFENTSAAWGPATSKTVLQLLAYAASQSNSGGSAWYGQVKAMQELAKDTFDAINNQVAFAP